MTADAFQFSSLYSSSAEYKKKSRKKKSKDSKVLDSTVNEPEIENLTASEKTVKKRRKRNKELTTEPPNVREEALQTDEKAKKKKKKKNTEQNLVEALLPVEAVPYSPKVSTCSDSDTQNIQKHQSESTILNTKLKKKKKGKKTKKGRRAAIDVTEEDRESCMLVEDLPLAMLLSHKFLLKKHFAKCGLTVKNIGVAEVYPAAEPRAVFTTCVQFDSPPAAQRALLEDGARVKGVRAVRIRVQPVPSATDTTVVVRCRGGCAPGLLSPVFASCGRVRSIREVIKGHNSTPVAFVEFSGTEGAERALAAAADARIGGAKVHVSRYQRRRRRSEVQDQDSA